VGLVCDRQQLTRPGLRLSCEGTAGGWGCSLHAALCANRRCAPLTPPLAACNDASNPCPGGQVCAAGVCRDHPCAAATCPTNHRCVAARDLTAQCVPGGPMQKGDAWLALKHA
jgi:hypothetical protein